MTLASRSRISDQLKWAEYIGVSIVAQFLLFPHVEGEVLEGNLLSGVDRVIQGFRDVIDFLVAGIDAPPYQSGAIDVRKCTYGAYPFQSRDFQMIVDCKCKPNFSSDPIEDLYVFLVQLKDNTAIIVGWSEFGQLLPQRVVKNYGKYGDVDFSYQFVSKYGMIHIIFPIAASYKIPLDAFSRDFTKTNVCVFNANDESIASDIEYVDGYCEGFMSIGFDESRIDAVPQFRDNITPKEIKALIRKEKDTFRRVWMWNALCAIEASSKNLFGRALDKKEGWLLSSALEDLKAIYDSGEQTYEIVEEMIKIYVALDQIANARTLYSMHFSKGYVSDDTAFNKCVKDLLEI